MKILATAGLAAALLAGVAIADHHKADEAAKADLEATMYTMKYTADDNGVIPIPAGAEIVVLPEYRGTGADGKPVVDKRPTLVVKDAKTGMWPVIIKMSPETAKQLHADLEKVLNADAAE